MIDKVGFWMRSSTILCLGLFAGLAATGALAADCPGHPDAIGTERTIVVDPREHPRIGTMQYPETLPLRDHEVVLTFDDGPLPRNSDQVLQTLADNCVKATFFLIGEQARANPEGVRKLAAAGHTIGSHSQTHPLTFHKMSVEDAAKQINDGIASISSALSDPTAIAPFFRIPGLLRADGVEEYLAGRGIQIWSADFLADDWHHISSARVYDLAMKRLEAHGKGILLLHDIQARTAAALPKILQEMKARGYKIVQVVPATLQDAGDADRSAGLEVQSAVRIRADRALAEGSGIRVCRDRHACLARAVGFQLTGRQAAAVVRAARAREESRRRAAAAGAAMAARARHHRSDISRSLAGAGGSPVHGARGRACRVPGRASVARRHRRCR